MGQKREAYSCLEDDAHEEELKDQKNDLQRQDQLVCVCHDSRLSMLVQVDRGPS